MKRALLAVFKWHTDRKRERLLAMIANQDKLPGET